ncbi:MAG: dienelactone hydrolase family protein, partial [Bacteroidota bacterium]
MTKNKQLLFLLLIIGCGVQAQNFSCCINSSVNHQNNLLAMNESFAGAHLTPEPFTLENPKGVIIPFKATDGKQASAYLIKSPKPTAKVLFVYHEWWGLNDYIKQEAEKLCAELGDVDVYAIDLYDGKVATTVPEAQKLMGEMNEERSKAIINGAIALAGRKAK